jgi:hypothetical protein
MKTVILTAVILLNPCESVPENTWVWHEYMDYGYLNMTLCQEHKKKLQDRWLYIQAVCR